MTSTESGVHEAFAKAARDRLHGAAEIERTLINALLDCRAVWRPDALVEASAILAAGQPAMANLKVVCAHAASGDLHSFAGYLVRRSEVLCSLSERLAANAWPWIERCPLVLSLSRSSAVAAALRGAHAKAWRGRVVVFDGTPSGGGESQASWLASVGVDAVSQPDATMPAWLDRAVGGAVVLVGADAVSSLRVVNVTGTSMLLEAAAARGIASLVIADTGKSLPDAELDHMMASCPWQKEDGPQRSWPVFELISRELLKGRIDERLVAEE